MKRRHIIKNGALAGAAVLLPAGGALAADPQRRVAAGLSVYSGRVLAIAEGGEVRLLASIDNMKAFQDAEARRKALPYPNITADGNELSFTHRGTIYRIENVLPRHFDSRAKDLS